MERVASGFKTTSASSTCKMQNTADSPGRPTLEGSPSAPPSGAGRGPATAARRRSVRPHEARGWPNAAARGKDFCMFLPVLLVVVVVVAVVVLSCRSSRRNRSRVGSGSRRTWGEEVLIP